MGMEYVATERPKRPVDVRFSPDGEALYIADVGAVTVMPGAVPAAPAIKGTGAIWRVIRADRKDVSPRTGISAKPGR